MGHLPVSWIKDFVGLVVLSDPLHPQQAIPKPKSKSYAEKCHGVLKFSMTFHKQKGGLC